jgi:pantoate--beta-alanine ligase
MQIAKRIDSLQQELAALTMKGESLALVPTMGNLHAGHLSLIREARTLADRVVVTIFVNPLQFDREADLEAYPRTLEEDVRRLEKSRADLLFAPHVDEIYPSGSESSRVHVPVITAELEGASRPGHFDGVATIVAKLFNLIQPDVALFGEKDYQQLLVIRKMVQDLAFPVTVLGMPTVRDSDGLAMSSRNGYLTEQERKQAPEFFNTLRAVELGLREGREDFGQLQAEAMSRLEASGFKPEYVEVRHADTLAPAVSGDKDLVVLAAAWLGKARLIDNIPVFLEQL